MSPLNRNSSVTNLTLSSKARNRLSDASIVTIGQIYEKHSAFPMSERGGTVSGLFRIRQLGIIVYNEINIELQAKGFPALEDVKGDFSFKLWRFLKRHRKEPHSAETLRKILEVLKEA